MISVDRLTTAQRRAIFAAQDRMVQAHPKTLQALMGFELVQRYHDHREQIPTKYQLTIQGQQIQNALRLMHQIDYHNPHLQKIVDQLSPEQRSTLLLINCEGMGQHIPTGQAYTLGDLGLVFKRIKANRGETVSVKLTRIGKRVKRHLRERESARPTSKSNVDKTQRKNPTYRKPRSIQGYKIAPHIEHGYHTHNRNHPGDKSYTQQVKGLGVSGPNIEENNPRKLRELGEWLIKAAEYLEHTKSAK